MLFGGWGQRGMTIEVDPRRASSGPPPEKVNWAQDPKVRGIFWQVVIVLVLVAVGWFLISNLNENREKLGIAVGYDFLDREAGFAIAEAMIPYDAASSYGTAFVVGILNTLRVAVLGIVLATVLGTIMGVARLSNNWLVAKTASVYVEVLRNLPVSVQLIVWYSVITFSMPNPRNAIDVGAGVFISNRGILVPVPESDPIWRFVFLALLIAIVAGYFVFRWATKVQNATGKRPPAALYSLGLLIGLPGIVWLMGGAPTAMSVPELRGFNFQGGVALTPEFVGILMGLTVYTSAFVAEIVRAGIMAVPNGQNEAAGSLGLSKGVTLRLIVLPQALRIIIPPTTSQYLNLTKNSSLAVLIGYPDLVSIGNTAANQTGQAIEAISIFMAVYLSISLSISLFMNWYNSAIALKER